MKFPSRRFSARTFKLFKGIKFHQILCQTLDWQNSAKSWILQLLRLDTGGYKCPQITFFFYFYFLSNFNLTDFFFFFFYCFIFFTSLWFAFDKNVMCRRGHIGVNQGSTRGQIMFLRNALWLQNLVGRTPDRKVMHC